MSADTKSREKSLNQKMDENPLYWFHVGVMDLNEIGACCMFDNSMDGTCEVMPRSAYNEYFKAVRKEILAGEAVVRPQWVQTAMREDDQWHVLVIESPSPRRRMYVSNLGFVLGIHVVGTMYAFPNKTNRDRLYKYLTKPA